MESISNSEYVAGLAFNKTAIANDNEEINLLNGQIENLQRIQENQATQIRRQANEVSEFEDRLKEAVENDEIDGDLAKEFADIFGLELSKEYNITITASWSGTLKVPFGQSVDDFSFSVEYPTPDYSCDEFELEVDEDETDFEVSESY
jgi:hypothetical protein